MLMNASDTAESATPTRAPWRTKSPDVTTSCQIDFRLSNLSNAEILRLNTYDFMAHVGKRVINPGGRSGREIILGQLPLTQNATVLEIGCGTGETACFIARRHGSRVTAVDISPAMVDGALRRVRAQRLDDRVDCRLADVLTLPFADGSFDFVICQAVLMFVDKTAALREIRRVLRPGGVFVGLEFSWRREPTPDVQTTTYAICGCRTLEFFAAHKWGETLAGAGLARCDAREREFNMLSVVGFLRDEGLRNTIKIVFRLVRRVARMRRMAQIWSHFARHRAYFSYTTLYAEKAGP